MQKRRSIDTLKDCDGNDDSGEAETLPPSPSPELRYDGSPYSSPSHPRQKVCSTLRGIAEEEVFEGGVEMQNTQAHLLLFPRYSDAKLFGDWRDRHALSYSSVALDASLSIFSKLNDDLVEDTSRLSLVPETLETTAFSGEMAQVSDEDMKIQAIFIEKMEQYEACTQRLRATKKQTTSVPEDCKKPLTFEAENDDIIILNDVQNDFSLNEDIPANQGPEILNDDNLEVTLSGRKIGDMKNLESHSDGDEFHDTLDEIELLMKFGMDYMMSSNDGEYPSVRGNRPLSHSVSTPKQPLGELSEFEDFGMIFRLRAVTVLQIILRPPARIVVILLSNVSQVLQTRILYHPPIALKLCQQVRQVRICF
jgi:hypothetical protein